MTTPTSIYNAKTLSARAGRIKGPFFAVRKGVIGVLYGCGCFIPGPISGEAGARVKDALARIAPCPNCLPKGYAFIQKVADGPLGCPQ